MLNLKTHAKEHIGVIGLGYVGLPLALALARSFEKVVGFDIDLKRIASLLDGEDWSGEVLYSELKNSSLLLSHDTEDLQGLTVFIVTVPTPIDEHQEPDLKSLLAASRTIAELLLPGSLVIYESSVYPGMTEEVCGVLLEEVSGLRRGVDFRVAYSPERINPGDPEHRLENTTKVVAGEDDVALQRAAFIYRAVIDAPLHLAPSIQVAEMAKLLENTQRDLNIALMNEAALICERLGVRTADVLEAAKTKWNFIPFNPGFVGGHCIGVDSYYLTAKAKALGYVPELILSARRVNEGMGKHVAQRVAWELERRSREGERSWEGERSQEDGKMRVCILGLSFKANVRDTRNSKSIELAREFLLMGFDVQVHDPLIDPELLLQQHGLRLTEWKLLYQVDAVVFAVPHRKYLGEIEQILELLGGCGVLFDVCSAINPDTIPSAMSHLSL